MPQERTQAAMETLKQSETLAMVTRHLALQVFIARLAPEAIFPHKAHPTDAGFDLAIPADCMLAPHTHVSIDLGFAIQIPVGWYGQIFARSSVFRQGLAVHPGVIDADFRGAVQLLVYNQLRRAQPVYRGDRLAQLLFLPVPDTTLVTVEASQLTPTPRGSGGIGSTGR